MSLYLKYRPKTLDEVIGNDSLINSLKGAIENKRIPHSILFHGPTGCGKTTLARIIANELGCQDVDIEEIDSAQFRGIDSVRKIKQDCMYSPLGGSIKMYILDEIHKMTGDAQNALLKVLEDTPSHVYFILCTTEPTKLLPTIRGRCSPYQVSLLSDKEMKLLLKRIVKKEKEKLSSSLYKTIIKSGEGHPRNTIQILEQVLNAEGSEREILAQQKEVEINLAIDLARLLSKKAPWSQVSAVLRGLKDQDVEGVRRVVLGYASAVLVKTDNPLFGLILDEFIEPFWNSGYPALVLACYKIINIEEE